MRFLLALSLGVVLTMPAHAATPRTLHPGAVGKRVAALQWLLGGNRPNVFTEVKGTFAYKPNGFFGNRTAEAVKAYKWRIGYPRAYVKPVAGPLFFNLMLGKTKRPPQWIARAALRLKAVEAEKPTALALRIKAYEVAELGVIEQPYGSNRGPCISYPCVWGGRQHSAIQASTGAYGAAWCVSTQQDAFAHGGYGHFANNTASVYYAADYYAARSMLHAKPKVGALVLFIDYDRYGRRIPGTGHMGYVVKLTASGFVSIEGNANNRVLERWHQLGDRPAVFAYLPGVA